MTPIRQKRTKSNPKEDYKMRLKALEKKNL